MTRPEPARGAHAGGPASGRAPPRPDLAGRRLEAGFACGGPGPLPSFARPCRPMTTSAAPVARHRGDPLDARGWAHRRASSAVASCGACSSRPASSSRAPASTGPTRVDAHRRRATRQVHRSRRARKASGTPGRAALGAATPRRATRARSEPRVADLGSTPQLDQADCAWRVPHRRQNRAFADSDRPHSPQFCTPTLADGAGDLAGRCLPERPPWPRLERRAQPA